MSLAPGAEGAIGRLTGSPRHVRELRARSTRGSSVRRRLVRSPLRREHLLQQNAMAPTIAVPLVVESGLVFGRQLRVIVEVVPERIVVFIPQQLGMESSVGLAAVCIE